MRTLSLTAKGAMFAEQTAELFIVLVTIEHSSLVDPLRFSSDPTARISDNPLQYATVSRGNTFPFLPMTLTLPDEASDKAPEMQLVLDNVLRDAVPLARSISTPASVTVEFVLKSDLDTVEATWPEFDLTSVQYDSGSITLTLQLDAMAVEPYPSGSFRPGAFPGLF